MKQKHIQFYLLSEMYWNILSKGESTTFANYMQLQHVSLLGM